MLPTEPHPQPCEEHFDRMRGRGNVVNFIAVVPVGISMSLEYSFSVSPVHSPFPNSFNPEGLQEFKHLPGSVMNLCNEDAYKYYKRFIALV